MVCLSDAICMLYFVVVCVNNLSYILERYIKWGMGAVDRAASKRIPEFLAIYNGEEKKLSYVVNVWRKKIR